MKRLMMAAAFALAGCTHAHAQERMAAFGLACDTKEQVVRFVEVFEKSAKVATAENRQGVFDIVEIRVYAAHTAIGIAIFETHPTWFALFQGQDRRT